MAVRREHSPRRRAGSAALAAVEGSGARDVPRPEPGARPARNDGVSRSRLRPPDEKRTPRDGKISALRRIIAGPVLIMKRSLAVGVLGILVSYGVFAQQRVRAVGPGPRPVRTSVPFGDPLLGISNAQRALFDAGKARFEQRETVESGLGPVFNSLACSECHLAPASGGGSDRKVTRIGTITNGKFDPLTQFGGSLLQARAIGNLDGVGHVFRPELAPPAATIV